MAGRSAVLDAVMVFAAESGPVLILMLFLGLFFWPGKGRRRRREVTLTAALAVVLALGVDTLPGIIYYRDRPFMAERVTLLVTGHPSASFPADHVAACASVAVVMGQVWRWLGAALWLVTAGEMVGRVFVGVHYPLDTVGGLMIGGLAGVLTAVNMGELRPFVGRVLDGLEALFTV